MNQEKLTFAFNALSRYGDIPLPQWSAFTPSIKEAVLKKNDYFVRQGTRPKQVGIIVSGILRVFCVTESGKEKNPGFSNQRAAGCGIHPFS